MKNNTTFYQDKIKALLAGEVVIMTIGTEKYSIRRVTKDAFKINDSKNDLSMETVVEFLEVKYSEYSAKLLDDL